MVMEVDVILEAAIRSDGTTLVATTLDVIRMDVIRRARLVDVRVRSMVVRMIGRDTREREMNSELELSARIAALTIATNNTTTTSLSATTLPVVHSIAY